MPKTKVFAALGLAVGANNASLGKQDVDGHMIMTFVQGVYAVHSPSYLILSSAMLLT